MTEFTIELAGVPIRVAANFDSTREFCRAYWAEKQPLFAVSVEREDVYAEAERSARENRKEGLPVQHYSPQYLETLALYRKIVERLVDYDIFLFHGSVVAVDGQGYLFTAKSGTGKSTHTRLWRQCFGGRAVMVNDDKPLLRVTEDGVLVCGTPWDGKHRLSTNMTVPLKGVCILRRGAENTIRPAGLQEALPMLLQQSHRPEKPEKLAKFLALIEKMAKNTGLFCLECNMEPEAAMVAYNGMKG